MEAISRKYTHHKEYKVGKPAEYEGPDNHAELGGSFLLLGQHLTLVDAPGAGAGGFGIDPDAFLEHRAQQRSA